MIECSDDIYNKTIYLVSGTDLIHMLCDKTFSLKIYSDI